MKRYVRTKDGRIIDLFYNVLPYMKTECNGKTYINFNSQGRYELVAESDDILDLIQVGDLVKLDTPPWATSFYEIKDFEYLNTVFGDGKLVKECITEIYTKQGNNYILVARRTEKGWEVL